MVHAEVHAPMEPSEPEVSNEAQIPDEALDQVRHPPNPKDPVEQETKVPKLPQLPIVSPQPKPIVLEQLLPQVLHMPRPILLPDTLLKVTDQPVPFQGSIISRPLT